MRRRATNGDVVENSKRREEVDIAAPPVSCIPTPYLYSPERDSGMEVARSASKDGGAIRGIRGAFWTKKDGSTGRTVGKVRASE